PLTKIADVIIPGQRGFQTSGNTSCDPMPEMPLADHLNSAKREAAVQASLAACRQKLEAAGVNLQGLNVEEMAADVNDIASSLGYRSIQLIGQSFGTHWGLSIIRQYPDLVARATLSALEGPDHTYDMPAGVAGALKRIAATAEASPVLAPLIPEEGLIAAYQALIDEADKNPVMVTYENEDTGEQLPVTLDGDAFRELARGYSRGTNWRYLMPIWPLDILNMLDGNLEGAARRYVRVKSFPYLQDAAYYQVDCASGISNARQQQLGTDTGMALVGNLHAHLESVCKAWDADLGPDFRQPFESDVPALLVHGDWDTSTPIENAETVRTFFTNHRFVQVEGGSHGAYREATEDVEGFEALIHHWMATGDYTAIPEKVSLPPLNWRTPD
ncbi:MAG: alpha/beta hydrolase, partial [Bacteroidota bacterium]